MNTEQIQAWAHKSNVPQPHVFATAYTQFATLARADLVAENEQLLADNNFGGNVYKQVLAERDALRTELEAAKADAVRYRWLAGKATQKTAYDIYENGGLWSIGVHSDDRYKKLHEVIDTAIAAMETPK
jgi:predicted N-acyltransferase